MRLYAVISSGVANGGQLATPRGLVSGGGDMSPSQFEVEGGGHNMICHPRPPHLPSSH